MKTLFGFGTNGGDEFVARAVHTSVNELDWTTGADGLKLLFVAGNEAANQDPDISVLQATQAAISRGIVVNTIYCGNEGDPNCCRLAQCCESDQWPVCQYRSERSGRRQYRDADGSGACGIERGPE